MNTSFDPSVAAIAATYQQRIIQTEQELRRLQQRIRLVGALRLVCFIAGIGLAIYFGTTQWRLMLVSIVAALIPFLALLAYHLRLYARKRYVKQFITVNQQELAALQDDDSAFDDGKAWLKAPHDYAFDLDVFGPHSLYQRINRTSTPMGSRSLATALSQHLTAPEAIRSRQEAVKELTPLIDLRQSYRVTGLLQQSEAADEAFLQQWRELPTLFYGKPYLTYLSLLVLVVNLCLFLCSAFGVLSFSVWGWAFLGFAGLGFVFTPRITKALSPYEKGLKILKTYGQLAALVEEENFESRALQAVQKQLTHEGVTASATIRQLAKTMDNFAQRNNLLVLFILNGLFLWELRQFIHMERWRVTYGKDLGQWLHALGEMDALQSMATFAYHHPEAFYPEILSPDGEFQYAAKGMRHPLMPRQQCVPNDISFTHTPEFIIITGSNMAGKSTYLRTLGINYLLALVGMPACAESMRLTPRSLVTALRTTDSLTDNESYFYAELKRLKYIIDRLERGDRLFIILDEILKGTNSIDKQKGSLALIQQFLRLRANGIIATHDLQLGALQKDYPEHLQNACFEATITEGRQHFSYRMQPGVARQLNACFLMRQMGIALPDTSESEAAAADAPARRNYND